MKNLFLAALLCLALRRSQTQALEQLQLNIEKLAQLKLMLSNMYNTYSILSNGYNNIKNLSLDNFKLHKGFIDGLSNVSPAVRNATAVADILTTQAKIVSEYNATFKRVTADRLFTPAEVRQLTDAYSNILSKTSRNLDALQQVLTAKKLQMSEAERLEILHSLALDMDKQLLALRTFTKQADFISTFRKRSKQESEMLRNQFGVTK
jgi:hypothetical protein